MALKKEYIWAITNEGEKRLAELGYKQELNRNWSVNSDRLPGGKVVFDYEFFTSSGNAQILGQWVQ